MGCILTLSRAIQVRPQIQAAPVYCKLKVLQELCSNRSLPRDNQPADVLHQQAQLPLYALLPLYEIIGGGVLVLFGQRHVN